MQYINVGFNRLGFQPILSFITVNDPGTEILYDVKDRSFYNCILVYQIEDNEQQTRVNQKK